MHQVQRILLLSTYRRNGIEMRTMLWKRSHPMNKEQSVAKLKSANNRTELSERIKEIIIGAKTTIPDLLEGLRISESPYIRESMALELYARTKRPRKAPRVNSNFQSWLNYIIKHPELIPPQDWTGNESCWIDYLIFLQYNKVNVSVNPNELEQPWHEDIN